MDGSKCEEGVGATAMLRQNKIFASLPHVATIFTAEVVGLKLAAKLIELYYSAEKFLVCSDSLSVLLEMRNVLTSDHLVQRVQQQFHQMIENGYDVTLTWVPSHVGILGNESVDSEAKKAHKSPEFIPIPFRNWFPEIRKRTNELWNQKCREERRDFYELKPTVRK